MDADLFKAQVTSLFFLTHRSGQKLFCLEFFSKQLYIYEMEHLLCFKGQRLCFSI